MPADIIPSQATNLNTMLDGNVLHGEQAGGLPYLKETLEAIVNGVNALNSESSVTPGAGNVGVKTASYTNIDPGASRNVAAVLDVIDSQLGASATDTYVFGTKYPSTQSLFVSSAIVKSAGTISAIKAMLLGDSGLVWDSMSAVGSWVRSNADGSTPITVSTTNYVVGGASLTVDKSGTAVSNICGMTRTDLTSTNFASKKVKVKVYVPTVSGGTFVCVRITLASDTGFANSKYWNKTVDVAGRTIVANGGWYTLEVDPINDAQTGSAGAINTGALVAIKVELELSVQSATFSGLCVDHLVIVPDAVDINVNLKKITTTGTKLIKSTGDTYTFGSLRGGEGLVTLENTALENATLLAGDILYLDVPTAGSFGGDSLIVMVET